LGDVLAGRGGTLTRNHRVVQRSIGNPRGIVNEATTLAVFGKSFIEGSFDLESLRITVPKPINYNKQYGH